MSLNYAEILCDYGLATEENSCEVSTAFFHEIHNTIGLNPLILSLNVEVYPAAKDYLVECRVVCQQWASVEATAGSLVEQWERELRYDRPRLNIVEISAETNCTYVRFLSIGVASGVSCQFAVVGSIETLE